jgi:hypothetical protein
MIKSIIRNKVKGMLDDSISGNYTLYYSSFLGQLYILYILLAGIALMLVAHLSIWPIVAIIIYMLCAYLFGTFRNHCFALSNDKLWIINGRTPFVSLESIYLSEIKNVIIATNKNPILDRIFIMPSNVFVEVHLKNGKELLWYTNVLFNEDYPDDKSFLDGALTLDDFSKELTSFVIPVHIEMDNILYD